MTCVDGRCQDDEEFTRSFMEGERRISGNNVLNNAYVNINYDLHNIFSV